MRGLLAGAMTLVLGACAVATPLAIRSSGARIAPGAAVELVRHEGENPQTVALAGALADAFARRSVTVGPGGGYLAEFALSQRAAAVGVASATPAGVPVEWQSPPRRSGRFAKCRAQRLRVTLVLFARESGEVAYRGVSERDDCAFDRADIAAAAEALVVNALSPDRTN